MTLRSHPFTYGGSIRGWSLGVQRGKRSPIGPCLTSYISFPSVKLDGKKVVLRFGMIKRSACNSISLPIHAKNIWEEFQSIVCVYALNRLTHRHHLRCSLQCSLQQFLLSLSLLKYNPSPPHPRSRWPCILMTVIMNENETTKDKIKDFLNRCLRTQANVHKLWPCRCECLCPSKKIQLNRHQHPGADDQSQILFSFMVSFHCHDTGSLFVISAIEIKKEKNRNLKCRFLQSVAEISNMRLLNWENFLES